MVLIITTTGLNRKGRISRETKRRITDHSTSIQNVTLSMELASF